jgi:GPN-loop GTPase
MAGKKTYNINLDPAVLEVNFPANIDIRDSVKYKNIMKTYKLGNYIYF